MTSEFMNPWSHIAEVKTLQVILCTYTHKMFPQGIVTRVCNPNTQEAEAVGSWAIDWDPISINTNPFS